ncbi:MAG TPA: hypothetical protein ENJ55_01015, partial [Rhizobiales bacterium]|nr:hypothetical protein [Hyphomicrobiales bacterium]
MSKLFFTADQHNLAGTTGSGMELWTYDGGAGGPQLVKDINPGTNWSNPTQLTAFGDKVAFVADDGTNGTEVWISDGTSAGTMMLKDINPGAGMGNPDNLAVLNGSLIFFANQSDGAGGRGLWTSDGTPGGTTLVKTLDTFGG